MFRFESPYALLLLIVPILALAWRHWRQKRRGQTAIPVPSVQILRGMPRSLRQRLQWLPTALLVLTWCLLTCALARPQSGQEQVRNINHGIAIEMIIDRSGSMRAPMDYRRKRQNRLETVKQVFGQFVFGERSADLKGRSNDLIGVIGFAHYPYTFCPLTLDHDALAFSLKNIQLITEQNDENGTAIGDAVAMGVARLADAERTLEAQTQRDAGAYRIKSKIIILLTDGQDEGSHTRSIAEAAELAKEHGIRVYTIAILGKDEQAGALPFGRLLTAMSQQYDTSEIEALAKYTGGLFQTCDSSEALQAVYHQIDQLEKSEIEAVRYVTHHELYFPFAAGALATLLGALILRNTIFSRLPC
jgi:Ca-activated chloride channel homolog